METFWGLQVFVAEASVSVCISGSGLAVRIPGKAVHAWRSMAFNSYV